MPGKRSVTVILAFVLMTSASAQERVDLFDTKGRRTDYAIVNRESGRVDFYDVHSRRTGWGRVDSTGRVEQFGLDGRRQGETVLPAHPLSKGKGGD